MALGTEGGLYTVKPINNLEQLPDVQRRFFGFLPPKMTALAHAGLKLKRYGGRASINWGWNI